MAHWIEWTFLLLYGQSNPDRDGDRYTDSNRNSVPNRYQYPDDHQYPDSFCNTDCIGTIYLRRG
jgi:hypothetical protein